jgi:hypothetical protein
MQTPEVSLTPPLSYAPRYREWGDRFLVWMGWVLLGYALLGRGFAYLGVPPLYVGEISLLFGLVALAASSGATAVLRLPLVRVLLLFMAWGALCTVPYVGQYGIDALRDAVLWGYGVFAVVVAGVLVHRPDRLLGLLLRYRRFVVAVAAFGWLALALKGYAGVLPRVPGSNIPIVQAKSADVLVHASAALAFVVLGMRRAHPVWVVLLALPLVMGNRAGMLAGVVTIALAMLLAPRKGRSGVLVYAACCALIAVALLNPTVTVGQKTVSADLVLTKVESIFSEGDVSRYNNTREWRLEWWGAIVDYTVNGPYFWAGKGYGINLSTDDGFKSGAGEDLRSPHNGHMTVLARSGVPGFALWLVLHLGWLGAMAGHYVRARREQDDEWAAAFAFLLVYWLAIMLIATFEVTLESPMGGIWMWTVFGVGLGAMHIHRWAPESLRPPRGQVAPPG